MDKKRSILNVSIAIATKVVILVLALLVRRFLIKYAGNDANGVYSLYTSIIGFLAVADLGIGTAINFSLYKPIVDGDTKKVASLYNLYKKAYLVIGAIILAGGLAVMPALPTLAKGYSSSYNLYLTFGILLASVVLNYAYSSKTSLINAYKNNYITTLFNSVSRITRHCIQLIVLYAWKSFELYLVAEVVGTCLEWLITEIYTRIKHKDVIHTKEKVDETTKKEVLKNTGAMFMHKIGGVLVNTADSIIISAFISVVILGKYTNYTLIVTSMNTVLLLFFTPLTAIIGHLCAEGNLQEEKKYFRFMYYFNFVLGLVFFLGYYAVIDDMVALFFGADLIMEKTVPLIITLNYFIQFMRSAVLVYRDATGTFYNDRWKPLVEGLVNIGLSIAFVYWIGLVGVIVATIITNIFICHIVEPYVLYKHGFNKEKPTKYYFLNYGLILVFCAALAATHFAMQHFTSYWKELFVNGFISIAISLVPITGLMIISKTFRTNAIKLFKYLNKPIAKLFKRNKQPAVNAVETKENKNNQ